MPVSNQGPACAVVLAGPINTGSGADCTTVSSYSNGANATTVNITAGSASIRGSTTSGASLQMVPFTFAFAMSQSGHIGTGTFSNATPGLSGSVAITNAGSASYMASAGAGNNVGTFTLTIAKSATLTNTANGTAYLIDGTLDATVPAVTASGATGAVTVHTTFRNN